MDDLVRETKEVLNRTHNKTESESELPVAGNETNSTEQMVKIESLDKAKTKADPESEPVKDQPKPKTTPEKEDSKSAEENADAPPKKAKKQKKQKPAKKAPKHDEADDDEEADEIEKEAEDPRSSHAAQAAKQEYERAQRKVQAAAEAREIELSGQLHQKDKEIVELRQQLSEAEGELRREKERSSEFQRRVNRLETEKREAGKKRPDVTPPVQSQQAAASANKPEDTSTQKERTATEVVSGYIGETVKGAVDLAYRTVQHSDPLYVKILGIGGGLLGLVLAFVVVRV